MDGLKFLQERQTRRLYGFLVMVCVLQAFFLGICGVWHVFAIRHVLAQRELTAASCLLEQEVSPVVIAEAWNHTAVTEAGRELLSQIGHTEQAESYLRLLAGQTAGPFLAMLAAGGIVYAAALLIGAGIFLQKRERAYEAAERIVTGYAEEKFTEHLPVGETGALYQLFGRVEQLALSLQARSETQRRAKEFLRDMISDISHQLKTPLAALTMYIEIMEEEAGQEETVRRFTEKSVRSLERMEQLILALLKMARLDTGNIAFEKRRCDVEEVVAQALGELSERADREGKRIVREGKPGEQICCDPAWTKEALGNLVKNALDHTEAGGTIRIVWQRSPALLRLSVADDGCGIRPEDIHHIFKRFYRSRQADDRQGIGLGLPLAKRIVEEQGGSLSVESRPGEGSTFRISFPTCPSSQETWKN